MLRKIIAWSLVLSVTWTTWIMAAPLPQVASDREEGYEGLAKDVGHLASVVERMRAHIDRAQFDLGELLEKLNYDREEIQRFVREEIAFEQYHGLLRGARGTLMSKAGNALDQALLLASLLKDAGFEARIKEGLLSEADARLLLTGMTERRGGWEKPGDLLAMQDIVSTYLEDSPATARGFNPTELLEVLSPEKTKRFELAESSLNRLLNHLEEEQIKLGSPSAEQGLVEEARHYFWVEYRDSVAGSWQSVHPAVKDSTLFSHAIKTKAIHADRIPDSLQQRLELKVLVEQKRGDRLVVSQLGPAWERPVANLIGVPLSLSFVPSGLLAFDGTEPLREALSKTTFFVPVLNGSPFGQEVFDLTGQIIPLDAAASAMSGVFSTFSGKAISATGALGQLGRSGGTEEDEEIVALTAISLVVTAQMPNGESKSYQRFVMDRIGASTRKKDAPTAPQPIDRSKLSEQLAREYVISVAGGSYPSSFVLDSVLERVRRRAKSVRDLALEMEERESSSLGVLRGIDKDELGPVLVFSLFRIFDAPFENDVNYRHEPTIVSHRFDIVPIPPLTASVDVINNGRRAFRVAAGKPVPDPRAVMKAGVWETFSEGMLLESGFTTTSIDTQMVFDLAAQRSIPLRIMRPDAKSGVSDLGVSEDAAALLVEHLSSGYAVVVPDGMPLGAEELTAWWRIDPKTGNTLGVASDRRGVSATEFVLALTLISALIAGVACTNYTEEKHGEVQVRTCLKVTVCAAMGTAAIAVIILVLIETPPLAEAALAFIRGLAAGAGCFLLLEGWDPMTLVDLIDRRGGAQPWSTRPCRASASGS